MNETLKHPGNAFYERYWATTDDAGAWGPMSRHRRRLLLKELSRLSFTSLLDVSCGQGFLLQDVSRAHPGVRLAGTELANSALDHARRRVQAEFFELDLTRDKLDERFDCVVLSEVLEHLEDEESALGNLAAMTSGYLIITVPGGRLLAADRAAGDLRTYNRKRLETLLDRAEFDILRYRRFGFPMYDILYRLVMEVALGLGGSVGPSAAARGLGPIKRTVLRLIYGALFLNVPNRGRQIVVVARRRS